MNPEYYLKEGKQTKKTKVVKEVSKSFKGTDFEKIVKILEWINKNLKSYKNQKKAISIFAKRTADKIIRDGFYTGCHDIALVFVTLARSVGIPAKYIEGIDKINPQNKGHCVSEVFINNRWIFVDPTMNTICIVPARSDFYKQNYLIGEGLDSWDIGIKSFRSWRKKSNELIKKLKNIEINIVRD